ncbi:MAG: S53 family peptidase [Candidatus Acidiferrum sp.]
MRVSKIGILMLILVLGMLPSAMAQTAAQAPGRTAVPYPTAETPRAVDLGAMTAQPGRVVPMSVTVALSLRNLSEAEELMGAVSTPGNAQYHQFLTSEQFVERFAPTNADVASAITALARYGLVAQRATATTLRVTGMPADMERAFGVSLHTYSVAAHGNAPGYSYHAPLNHPTVQSELAGHVSGIFGLDTRPALRPHHVAAPPALTKARAKSPSTKPAPGLTNPPGLLTVQDFVEQYNVQPLYDHGITGKGRTLAIMTFASFTPSDAFYYWQTVLGLAVDPGRITIVEVDGGSGPPRDASGSDETTLDVEQSGGIAPRANVVVYEAPNTNQGSVDVYAAAIEANLAQSISISWGFWEWYQNLENSPVTDPITGKTVGITQATHELLVRAAIQGESVFTAAGDSGAYDADRDFGFCYPTFCSLPLTVDYPASDTAITAAGGTTLPGLQEYCQNAACTPPFYDINIPQESVWGWDYLTGLCATVFGLNPIQCGIFPGGTGGGVSIMFPVPFYQWFIRGVQHSQPGQDWNINPSYAALFGVVNTSYNLPAHYPGRNVPDVSFNADPDTGYIIPYTSEPSGNFLILNFNGGTSFVAPQLNGVTALLGQDLHSRLGLLNSPLYFFALTGQAYHGPNAPLKAISTGDNWFYVGSNGYNPAVGLGTLDVWNLAQALR